MTSWKLIHAHEALLAILDLEIGLACDPTVYKASVPTVSKWSVKDHLEHLSIAHETTVSWIERARDGDPDLDSGGSPSLVGRIVLLVGAFPRGRGKAPERTMPKGTSAEELAARFRGIRQRVAGLETSLDELQASNATRNHFAFGNLNTVQWLQFAAIHGNHHHKIIRDMVRSES